MSHSPFAFSLSRVSFSYSPSRPVLLELETRFEKGVFYAVIGPNGAGKSTLLGVLSGRLQPSCGEVLSGDKPVHQWPRREFARQVAVVPQREEAVFDFTVREVVLMGRFPYQKGPFGLEEAHDHEVVERALELTDLLGLSSRPIGSLSGGERQRALVARALAQETPVLLLDEPNSALDPLHQKMLMELFLRLNQEEGKTLVLVSHDLSLVGSYAKRVLVLSQGRILQEGPTEAIFNSEFLSATYRTRIGVQRLENGTTLVGVMR
jgi:iron complex transport system ATP-binding protein